MASGVMGGALYSAMGMIGPYTVLGIIAITAAYAQRLALPTVDDGQVHKNASIFTLLRSWRACGLLFALLVQFFALTMFEILWQPWVGMGDHGDYGWPPGKVSTLSLTMLGGTAFAVAAAMPLIPLVGNVWTAVSGMSVVAAALLFVGNKMHPPLLFPFIGPLPWLPYVIAATVGIGLGSYFVTVPPLTIEVIEKECGLSRAATNGPVAAVMVFTQALAIVLGPVVGGAVVSAFSVAGMCLVAFCIQGFTVVVFVICTCKYASIKNSDFE